MKLIHWPKVWRSDPNEAPHLIDAIEAWERGDLALFTWINQASSDREREFRRRASLALLAAEAEMVEKGLDIMRRNR